MGPESGSNADEIGTVLRCVRVTQLRELPNPRPPTYGARGETQLGPPRIGHSPLKSETAHASKLHRWATDLADPTCRCTDGRRLIRCFDDLFKLAYNPAFLVVAWCRVRSNKG